MSDKSFAVNLVENPSVIPNAKLADLDKYKSTPKASLAHSSRSGKLMANAPSGVFEVPAAPDPYYFKTSELEERPHVSADISPELAPSLGGDLPQSGILRLLINERGEIDQVIVDESSFSEANQRLVQEAFLKVKFEPGKIAGAPVKSELKIEIMLENTIARPYSQ